jgi:hypothetical protein
MRIGRSISLRTFFLIVMLLALGTAALSLSRRTEVAEREARSLRDVSPGPCPILQVRESLA